MSNQSERLVKVLGLILLVAFGQAFRFEVNNKSPVCIVEHLPKNQELVSQILVDPEAKNFAITVMHMNQKGKLVGSQKVKTYNSRDVYVHNEGMFFSPDGQIYVCLQSNTTKSILVEILPNLMLPDQESFPTADDAGTLQRELFVTNSKIMQLINQQEEFEGNEQRGMEVSLISIGQLPHRKQPQEHDVHPSISDHSHRFRSVPSLQSFIKQTETHVMPANYFQP